MHENAIPDDESRVRRPILSAQITETLRRDILTGVIPAGTRMSQWELCVRFGTSRTPVRDALRTLAAQGLAVVDEGNHIVAARLNLADFTDTYRAQAMLVGIATRRATERATSADIARLSGLHQEMMRLADAGSRDAIGLAHWDLHSAINRLSGSAALVSAIRSVAPILCRGPLEAHRFSHESIRAHAGILRSMKVGLPAEAERLMVDHVVTIEPAVIEEMTRS